MLFEPLISFIRYRQVSFVAHLIRAPTHKLARDALFGTFISVDTKSDTYCRKVRSATTQPPRVKDSLWKQALDFLNQYFCPLTPLELMALCYCRDEFAQMIREARFNSTLEDYKLS